MALDRLHGYTAVRLLLSSHGELSTTWCQTVGERSQVAGATAKVLK